MKATGCDRRSVFFFDSQRLQEIPRNFWKSAIQIWIFRNFPVFSITYRFFEGRIYAYCYSSGNFNYISEILIEFHNQTKGNCCHFIFFSNFMQKRLKNYYSKGSCQCGDEEVKLHFCLSGVFRIHLDLLRIVK